MKPLSGPSGWSGKMIANTRFDTELSQRRFAPLFRAGFRQQLVSLQGNSVMAPNHHQFEAPTRQRRCAYCRVPSSLQSSGVAFLERWASKRNSRGEWEGSARPCRLHCIQSPSTQKGALVYASHQR